jgi:hypothetical protein
MNGLPPGAVIGVSALIAVTLMMIGVTCYTNRKTDKVVPAHRHANSGQNNKHIIFILAQVLPVEKQMTGVGSIESDEPAAAHVPARGDTLVRQASYKSSRTQASCVNT